MESNISLGYKIWTKFSNYATILQYYGSMIDSVIVFRSLSKGCKESIDINKQAIQNMVILDKRLIK